MPIVDSSVLLAVDYEPATETLHVTFRSGAAYSYFHVPRAVYDALLGAPSKGRFFNAEIAPRFPFARAVPKRA
jgi:hypothetical protein